MEGWREGKREANDFRPWSLGHSCRGLHKLSLMNDVCPPCHTDISHHIPRSVCVRERGREWVSDRDGGSLERDDAWWMQCTSAVVKDEWMDNSPHTDQSVNMPSTSKHRPICQHSITIPPQSTPLVFTELKTSGHGQMAPPSPNTHQIDEPDCCSNDKKIDMIRLEKYES